MKRGRAAQVGGDKATAFRAFSRIYFEYPATEEAAEALVALSGVSPAAVKPAHDTVPSFLGRAERLYTAKRYMDAREAFESLKPVATGDDREVVTLRLAECDYFTKRFTASLIGLAEYVEHNKARGVEAEYFVLGNMRELGQKDYDARLRAFVDRDEDPALTERALMDLAAVPHLG